MQDREVEIIPLIGPKQTKYLNNLNIFTVKDLLFHIPYKYKDTSEIITIEELKENREGTIVGEIESIANVWTRYNKLTITKAKVKDHTGTINVVWFNQSFLTQNMKKGNTFLLEGKLSTKNDFSNPSYEKFEGNLEQQTHLGKITPFYHETAGISSKWLRSRINWLMDKIEEIVEDRIPEEILEKYNLINLEKAIHDIHFGNNFEEIENARKRLEFDEMLNISLQIVEKKKKKARREGIRIEKKEKEIKKYILSLPFALTKDQNEATKEILNDMKKTTPMNRLLNGDVGSGKTVVAGIAAYNAFLSGYSTIIMVPTTILAKQHYKTFTELFENIDIQIQLRIKKELIEPSLKPQIIIGTQALLYNTDFPKNTGLVIVDEQHRFGVNQRATIADTTNQKTPPHYLTMTATPIPRTLTSILYGDMDISLILNKPKNRLSVETYLISPSKREQCYTSIAKKIKESNFEEQAFIIFPLIEESEKIDAKAATIEFEKISKTIFKEIKTELLHGKMKEDQKSKILQKFKDKKIHALFSTSVIEVGIDIPDATIMIIESAERFGLAQLHQFRGRIGRGNKQAYCFVITHKSTTKTKQRLKYFSKNNSGFDIAEFDLKSRGPGEVYGLRQTGVPLLKVGNITNFELLTETRNIAEYIIEEYNSEEIRKNLFK